MPRAKTTDEITTIGANASVADGRQFYFEGDYEAAIRSFDAVLAHDDYDEESKITAAYWRAEASLKEQFSAEIIASFEAIADEYGGHHLATAAKRRADALRRYFATIQGENREEDRPSQ